MRMVTKQLSGMADIQGNATLILPFLPFHGTLMGIYSWTRILEEKNRNAAYIRPSDTHSSYIIMKRWTLF